MYNITPHFTSPELLNKYRDEEIINKKIEIDEKLNKQNKNLAKAIDKNLNKYLNKKSDISKFKDQYTFKNNHDILNSFIKIFNDYDLSYKPRLKTTEVSSQFELHRRDNTPLIPEIIEDDVNNIVPIEQQGQGALNNIKIDENSLNRNILKINYLNGRKLTNC